MLGPNSVKPCESVKTSILCLPSILSGAEGRESRLEYLGFEGLGLGFGVEVERVVAGWVDREAGLRSLFVPKIFLNSPPFCPEFLFWPLAGECDESKAIITRMLRLVIEVPPFFMFRVGVGKPEIQHILCQFLVPERDSSKITKNTTLSLKNYQLPLSNCEFKEKLTS